MSDLATAKFHDSEIAKSKDFNYASEAIILLLNSVFDSSFDEVVNSFVVAGMSVEAAVPPSMNVKVNPGLAFSRAENKLLHIAAPLVVEVAAAHATMDRIDTLEIKYATEAIDQETRAFRDPATGAVSYADVATKTKHTVSLRCVIGVAGAGVAPAVEAGYMKLAEISVPALTTQIIAGNIRGITAPEDAAENAAWTTQKAVSFFLGSADANKSDYLAHKASNITSGNTVHGIRQGHGNNFDADMVDGIESARMLFGDNGTGTTDFGTTSANDIAKSGFYRSAAVDGSLPASGVHYILHFQHPTVSQAWQIAVQAGTNNTYFRSRSGTGWLSWEKLWNAGNDGANSGLDADMVDGIESARIIFGDGVYGSINKGSGSCRDITKSGFYRFDSTVADIPVPGTTFYGIHWQHPSLSNFGWQILIGAQTNTMYYAYNNGGAWSAWVKIWNAGNDGADSGLDADLVDGIQGANLLSIKTAQTAHSVDWNTLIENAVYTITGAALVTGANGPTSAYGYGTLLVFKSTWMYTQIYIPHRSTADSVAHMIYHRNSFSPFSSWSSWKMIYDSGLVDAAHALTGNYLPVRDVNGIVRNPKASLGEGLISALKANVPEWPDDVAGMSYFQGPYAWTSVDGWVGNGAQNVASVEGGRLKIVFDGTGANGTAWNKAMSVSGKKVRLRITSIQPITKFEYWNGTTQVQVSPAKIISDNEWLVDFTPTYTGAWFYLYVNRGTLVANTVYVPYIYIGNGVYSSLSLDGSGNGIHATILGATPIEGGFVFEGLSDVVITSKHLAVPLTSEYTVAFRLAPKETVDYRSYLELGDTGSVSFIIHTYQSSIYAKIYTVSGTNQDWSTAQARIPYPASGKVHCCFHVKQEGSDIRVRVYENGVLRYNATMPGTLKNNGSRLSLGGSANNTRQSKGEISDVLVYSRGLSAAEVWELYQNPDSFDVDRLVKTPLAIPSSSMTRDANGRSKVAAPLEADDIARLDSVTNNAPIGELITRIEPTGATLPTPSSLWVPADGRAVSDAESPLNGFRVPNLDGGSVALTLAFTPNAGGSTATISQNDRLAVSVGDDVLSNWIINMVYSASVPSGSGGITVLSNGNVYVCIGSGSIYRQVGGSGSFGDLSQTARSWSALAALGSDVYACVTSGDIYKRTGESGNFVALGQTARSWIGMTVRGTDVYACVNNGDIYKQTGGTGNFVALGQTSRAWRGMAVLGNDVYACVSGGDIYKQTGGTGNFVALGQTSRFWRSLAVVGSDVYASVDSGGVYKQTGGTGNFVDLGLSTASGRLLAGYSSTRLYEIITPGTSVSFATLPGVSSVKSYDEESGALVIEATQPVGSGLYTFTNAGQTYRKKSYVRIK